MWEAQAINVCWILDSSQKLSGPLTILSYEIGLAEEVVYPI